MLRLTRENITPAVIDSIARTENPRLQEILSSLITHLHEVVRETNLTHEEWEVAIDFLLQAGQISDDKRNEFILMSDIMGISSLVDIVNSHSEGTETSVLGPFFVDGAEQLEVGGDMIGDNNGEPVVLSGRVLTTDGMPIEGALLDIWQNADNGLYDSQDAALDGPNLRCKMFTNANGEYRVTTVKPKPYTVPNDGPVGDILRAVGRHPWRPAHFHFKVEKSGYHPLVTELFDPNDDFLDEDAVFGVRETLVTPFDLTDSEEEASRFNVRSPFYKVAYDFVLAPA